MDPFSLATEDICIACRSQAVLGWDGKLHCHTCGNHYSKNFKVGAFVDRDPNTPLGETRTPFTRKDGTTFNLLEIKTPYKR